MMEDFCSSNDTPTHGLIDTDAFAAPMVDLQSMRSNRGSREAMEVPQLDLFHGKILVLA